VQGYARIVRRIFSLTRLRWPAATGRQRVFIEDADPDRYRIAAQALTKAGYEVGPFCGGTHFHGTVYESVTPPPCRLIESGNCPLLEGADVIVYRFGLESPENRAVLAEIAQRFPRTPVVVETTEPDRDALAGLHPKAEVLAGPAPLDDLVAAVRTLLERPSVAAS
jgi:hypothetical protein